MWDDLQRIWTVDLLGCSVGQFLGALAALAAGFFGRSIVLWLLGRLLKLAERRSATALEKMDDVLIHAATAPAGWGVLLLGLYSAFRILPLPQEPIDLLGLLNLVGKGVSILLLVWFVIRLSDRLFDVWADHRADQAGPADRQAIPVIRTVVRVFLILVGGAFILQNLGYSVGSLLAGLGLGGVAVALAAKDTLSNVFGAIVIFWDRPFRLGDWVALGGVEGTVEEVNLRTTRIRTFDHSLVTVPNASLTTANVVNWSRMNRRKFEVTVGLTVQTSPEQVEQAVEGIRALIEGAEDLHHDGHAVNLFRFGESSLDIEVVVHTVATDFVGHRKAKERFLLAVMRTLRAMGLSLAFPTRTVHVETGFGIRGSGFGEKK